MKSIAKIIGGVLIAGALLLSVQGCCYKNDCGMARKPSCSPCKPVCKPVCEKKMCEKPCEKPCHKMNDCGMCK